MKNNKSAQAFKALGDEIRLNIIDLLKRDELCACEILEQVSISQSTLSHHMKTLVDNGIVKSRKEGKWVYYSLNLEQLQNLERKLEAFYKD